MTLGDLVSEYQSVRSPGWLVLGDEEVLECGYQATRFYAAYGDIRSLSKSDVLQEAAGAGAALPTPTDPEVFAKQALPIKNLDLIDEDTDLSSGEWAVIKPLFTLYVERENAMRLEASRVLGVDVYGRSVAEVAADIKEMEADILPGKAFQACVIEV